MGPAADAGSFPTARPRRPPRQARTATPAPSSAAEAPRIATRADSSSVPARSARLRRRAAASTLACATTAGCAAPRSRHGPAPEPAPATDRPGRSRRLRRAGRRRWPRRRKLKWILLICLLLPIVLLAAGSSTRTSSSARSNGAGRLAARQRRQRDQHPDRRFRHTRNDDRGPTPAAASSRHRRVSGRTRSWCCALDGGGAKMLSIPRDLIVTLADTGEQTRINAAYNTDLGGGPGRLLKTVQQNLGIPINRYMEVDFVRSPVWSTRSAASTSTSRIPRSTRRPGSTSSRPAA